MFWLFASLDLLKEMLNSFFSLGKIKGVENEVWFFSSVGERNSANTILSVSTEMTHVLILFSLIALFI